MTEGDVVALRATVKKPKRAKRIFLQRWDVPLYFGNPSWENVRSVKVRKRTTTLPEVATSLNTVRYRIVVTRKHGKPLKSAPVNITVWRWIPLQRFATYSSTTGAVFGQTNINGARYKTWGAATWSNAGSWESRFTPGRNCKAFAGVLGVDDQSEDGSSGTVALTADDVSIYQSPALMPGMSMRIQMPLALPYRFGLRATDTSPDGVDAFPVIGDPALLCTGIA
ncbi:hypothetical protein [Nocardioides daeguensis]|uniref:hypothetical protein n=1 Tax=Nocardioides daeguensis TaxID=908359 RepID=UPI001C465E57|nr:hypothetical protein [Nocardioides daeguensis]MBV6729762.1 hypothetical protein [Nocardioides daeguensis]MCR1772425.1 hypothetical protein [Nocardioides daeguensis]